MTNDIIYVLRRIVVFHVSSLRHGMCFLVANTACHTHAARLKYASAWTLHVVIFSAVHRRCFECHVLCFAVPCRAVPCRAAAT
jgi:hypothetical protein